LITANCSGDISPDALTEPTHKRKWHESGWKQNIRETKRDAAEEYVSSSAKIITARVRNITQKMWSMGQQW